MYLKQLDLLGFKSFASKTSVHFANGITAIVGPNGCGKTNILDSMRWVLGEQRVSLLRGGKMEEVIFNGTRDVKPLGMAEVTMTLVNDRGILPTEYHEVQVTRRLFRSGESEYLLNKVPCRLKDIAELFYDTGVGAHSYSVIQQEMIDSVISDRAEERRFLFEEAAGITKYKQRKKAAQRKLEATEQDVLRLQDIHSEVQTQVRSLKRQHRKAERYKAIADDVRNWELYLSARRVQGLEAEISHINSQLSQLSDQRLERENVLDRLSAELEADRKEQLDLEQQLTAIGNQVFEATEQAHSLEKQISVLAEKRTNAAALIERNRREIQSLQSRDKTLSEQETNAVREIDAIGDDLASRTAELQAAEETLATADRQLLETRAAHEQESRRLIDLESRLSSGQTEDAGLREQEADLHRLLKELDEKLEAKQRAIEESNAEAEKLEKSRSELSDRKAKTAAEQKQLSDRIENLLEQNDELTEEIAALTASIEATEARCHLLQEMIVHYEGYETGAVAALESRDRFGDGLVGTVAELFVPASGMEAAVEAALGAMAGFVVCRDRATAESIISYLRKEKRGRIGILLPDTGTLNPVVKRPDLSSGPGFLGWMDSFVSAPAEIRPLMETIVARTVVFEHGQDPSAILEKLPYGFQAVSTEGVLYSNNVITGGSDDRFPLFRRQEKLADQNRALVQLQTELQSIRRRKDRLTAEVASARADSVKLSEQQENLAEEYESIKSQVNECGFKRRSADSEAIRLRAERKETHDKLERIFSRQHSLGLNSDQLRREKDNLSRSLDDLSQRLKASESAAGNALEQVSKLQVAVVEARSRLEQARSKRTHLSELRQEIGRTSQTKENEITAAENEIEQSAVAVSDLEGQLKAVFEDRTGLSERQSQVRNVQSDLLERIGSREKELKEIRNARDSLGEQTHQIDMRRTTLDSEVKSICDRIRDEYDEDIVTLDSVSPDEDRTEEQAREHLTSQKEQLRKFGAVNLLALEEYETIAERERFLKEQLDDLTAARTDLQTTIGKINNTARSLFTETFDKVRENFKRLFVELFSGGEADIFLEDPADPLESAIEITARPGRKRLLSISQMSGGERALTAIALLFALYLVKRSPFCVLDEIDAPLDDANCRRFLKMIETFSDLTQFIIITHNKITMEAADNLYGVTMEQPGVSKLVAVRFADVYEDEATGVVRIDTTPSRTFESDDLSAASSLSESSPDPEPQSVGNRTKPDFSGDHD